MTERLRIALASDWCLPRFGGLELQLRDLALALTNAGHRPDIFTTTPGDSAVDGIPVHRLHGARLPPFGITCSPRPFREFRRALEQDTYDVVHVHSGLMAPFAYGAALTALRAGVPVVVTFHSVYSYMQPMLAALSRTLRWRHRAIVWSAVSSHVAREVQRTAGLPDVRVLPNGIDPTHWNRPRRSRAGGTFVIVSASRLKTRKRPAALVHAASRAHQALAPGRMVRLLLAGDGPARRTLERRARRAAADVRLLGSLQRHELAELYRDADVFALAGYRESFGLAALEARAAGVPVVARADSGAADFIRDGVEGLLVRSDAELADALVRLARDPALHERIARHNRETAPPNAWPQVVARTIALYAEARGRLTASRGDLTFQHHDRTPEGSPRALCHLRA
jgi:glycosyltransferase involved in cell wall biosynthesis